MWVRVAKVDLEERACKMATLAFKPKKESLYVNSYKQRIQLTYKPIDEYASMEALFDENLEFLDSGKEFIILEKNLKNDIYKLSSINEYKILTSNGVRFIQETPESDWCILHNENHIPVAKIKQKINKPSVIRILKPTEENSNTHFWDSFYVKTQEDIDSEIGNVFFDVYKTHEIFEHLYIKYNQYFVKTISGETRIICLEEDCFEFEKINC